MCALLAPVLLTVRALEDCRGIEWADFLNSFPFLKYPGMAYQPLTSCRLIPEYFKKGKSASSIPWQISSALTAKSTVLIMHTTLQIWQIKSEVYTKTISYEISACVKSTTLPILVRVLASINYWKVWFLTLCSSLHTRNKQQKFAQGKLSCKPRPFVCRYPVTLIVGLFVCMLRCLFCNKCTYPSVDKKKWMLLIPSHLWQISLCFCAFLWF